MFVLLFIILFHNGETGMVRLVKLKFGEELKLEHCPKGWTFYSYDNKTLPPAFKIILTKDEVGFYICPDGDSLFALAIIDSLKFIVTNDHRKVDMVGEKINFYCGIEVHPGAYIHGHIYTMVTDSSKTEVARNYKECIVESCNLTTHTDYTLVKPGSETFNCKFSFKVMVGQMNVDYVEILNKTIHVYMAPTNVNPDLKVKKLDTPINCTADGEPSPTIFKWTCEGTGWQSEGRLLKFQDYGEYYCICTANNTIGGTVYGGMWNGTITIMAGAERRFPSGITFLTAIIAQIVQHVK